MSTRRPRSLNGAWLLTALGICVLGLAEPCAAQEWDVSAELDKPRASRSDVLTYRVSAVGSGEATPRIATPPRLGDFVELGTSSATSIVSHGGQIAKSYEFVWRITPRDTGTLTIEGATIAIGDERFEPAPVTVDVADTSARASRGIQLPKAQPPPTSGGGSGGGGQGRAPGQGQGQPNTPPPVSATPVPEEGEDYFIEVNVAAEQPYLGEPFSVTYELFRAASLIPNLYDVHDPNFTGFWPHETTDRYTAMSQRATRAGRRYAVEPVRAYVLVPIETGALTISPAEVEVPSSTGLFRGAKHWIASPTTAVEARPLPAGAPVGFDVANVGRHLKLEGAIRGVGSGLDELRVGDSIVVSVTIRGEGLVEQMRLAPIADADGFLTFGPDVEEMETDVTEGRLQGIKRFKATFVPTREGVTQISGIRFVYFDLSTESYREKTLGPWDVTVSGKAPNADDVVKHAEAQRLAARFDAGDEEETDLPGARAAAFDGETGGQEPLFQRAWYIAIMLLMPLAWVSLSLGARVKATRVTSQERRRTTSAYDSARRALKKAKKGSAGQDVGWVALVTALRGYLTDAWSMRARALTERQLQAELVQKGLGAADADRLSGLIQRGEDARYAPTQAGDIAVAVDEALEVLTTLEHLRRDAARTR